MFWNQGKMKAVTFSYDDGVTQDIRLITLMNKYGLKGTFNLNSQRMAENRLLRWNGAPICQYTLHRGDIKGLYEGHEVAAHTLTHAILPECDDAEVIRQVEQDRLDLSELVGYEVVGMAYPGNGRSVTNDDRVAEIIKNHTGIRYSRTTSLTGDFELQDNLFRFKPTAQTRQFDKLMELGKAFVEMETDKPQIFYIWGHAYEMDYTSDSWVRLEEFFRLISNRDDIFYGTNKEVLL